jgi:DNA-binding winged helix-turn-helix (wHTH) protein/TolB-like protein/Flp pilus assembly protein TadD
MMKADRHLYEFGPFRLDPAERRLLCDDKPVALTPKCFDLLVVLVENGGHLLEKEELLGRVWPDQFVEESNLSFNISALRKLLGDGRNGQHYIETVPKKGFRFVAHVEKCPGEEIGLTINEPGGALPIEHDEAESERTVERTDETKTLAPPVSSKALSRRQTSLKILVIVFVASVLGFVAYSLWPRRAVAPAAQPLKTIAVLPFKPLSADSRDESLEMGMAETLITKLSNLKQVAVRPMSAVRKYTDPSQDPIKAGQELQTEVVLDGSIQKAGDRVRMTVRLLNVQTGATLWAEQFDENFTDIFKVQDSISGRVTNALRLRLSGDEEKQLAKRYTDNPEAYQLYLQGEYLWYKWDDKSLEFYQRAIEKDPKFALAYIGIAESYLHLVGKNKMSAQEGIPKARDAITKALELDETLAEAQNTLAEIKYQFEYDWQGAEKDFKRAVELNPNVAQIRLAYGWYLMTSGRFNEALPQMKRAQELDPHNIPINRAIGKLYYFMRQYDKAMEHYQNLLVLEPNDQGTRGSIADIYEQKGMYAEAVEERLKNASLNNGLSPEEIEESKEAFRVSGWQGFLQIRRARMEERAKKETVVPTNVALLYARLGDKDRAFAWLEKAINERDPSVVRLKIDPMYDSLRSDPRYARLLQRMNLTP